MDLHSAPGIRAAEATRRVLFVDHETRLSGGQQDLVDLIGALDPSRVEAHVALPAEGPLAEALRARGATVHLLTMGREVRGLSRYELTRRPGSLAKQLGSLVAASIAIWRLIGRVRPALVHTNSMKAHLLTPLPALLRRVPLVMHVRDILPPGWLRSSLVAASAGARRVVCLSAAAARQFDGTRAASKTVVVHNGIELERFAGSLNRDVRASLGAPNGEVLVGIVGQIAHWKGQDVVVEAAARVVADHPRARFAVIGECMFPINEAEFDRAVRERARDLPVTFAGWVEDVGSAVGALDVLVHASREPEPFGRVLVEGMAAGKPVVTTTIGAGPEIVPPEAGRLVAPGDAEALARALGELIADPAERARCGKRARAAAERFHIANTARAIEALYEEIGV